MGRYIDKLCNSVVVYNKEFDGKVKSKEDVVYLVNMCTEELVRCVIDSTQNETGYYFYLEAPSIKIRLCKEGDAFTQGILKLGKVAFSCNLLKKLQKEDGNTVFKFLDLLESNVCRIREILTKSGVPADEPMTKELLVEHGIVDILGLYEYEMEFKDILEKINKYSKEVF